MREVVDDAKEKNNDIVIFVFGEVENKLSLAVGVSGNYLKKFDASDLAKKISKLIDGKGGGGRRDFAQAGGNVKMNIDLIFSYIENNLLN